jgi:hypothetical protein
MQVTPSISEVPSLVDQETDEVILRGRIKTPQQLLAAYQTYFNADLEASRARALQQAQIDGAPPYSDADDRMKGLRGRTNANFGFAATAQEEAEQPFNDVLDALDVFGKIPTRFGTETERMYYSSVISEEITKIVRSWDDFYANWYRNTHLFTKEGISFNFFKDDRTWQWEVYGRQHFKIPRRVRANVTYLDLVTCRMEMMPHELHACIKNREAAEAEGWNYDACMLAIKGAVEKSLENDNPQSWQQEIKDQAVTQSGTSKTITVIHGFSQEVDGSVSHYIAKLDGENKDTQFLYKSLGKWNSMHRCLVAFTNAVGSNGDFDSIRGNGYRIFQSASALNRMFCKALDAFNHASTPYLSYESEDAITANAFHPMGPYVAVANDLKFTEAQLPNVAQNLLPALDLMQGVFASRARFSAPVSGQSPSRTEKTKYQVQVETEQSGRMSTSSFNLFFVSWGNLFREVVRRLCREDYAEYESGGREAWKLRQRLLERDVPLEALYQVDIDGIEVNTGIGKGSVAERRAQVDALMERLFPALDPNGQQTLLRYVASAYSNSRIARELVPDSGPRKPLDAQIAKMENSLMGLGMPPAFEPDQNHGVHVQEHLAFVAEINDALAAGEMELADAIPAMQGPWQHAQDDHLPLMNPNAQETAQFRQALQQFGEVIVNGGKFLAREQQKAMEEQAAMEGVESSGASPLGVERQAADAAARTEFLESVKTQAKAASLQLDLAAKQQAMELSKAKAEQEMALRDAKTAAEIVRSRAKQQ